MKITLETHSVRKQKKFPASLVLFLLTAGLCFSIMVAVNIGGVAISPGTTLRVILNGTGLFHFEHHWEGWVETIIWQYRLPGVIAVALVGAALGVAGTLFQGLLRNPLADPFLIGTSSGAALGATIAFVLPVTTIFIFPITPVLAFVGAIITVLFVYLLARTEGQTPVVTLLLAGVVVNAVLVACQTLLLTLRPPSQASAFVGLFSWLSGQISVVGWSAVSIVAGCVILGSILAWGMAGVLDVFSLGEEHVAHLGLHVEAYKFIIVLLASLLTAAAVSISGLIGFVGLVTPHVARLLLGPRHRLLLPATALGGAIFLIWADLLAHVVAPPTILPIGIFTAFVGAPFFLFLLRRRKRDYRW